MGKSLADTLTKVIDERTLDEVLSVIAQADQRLLAMVTENRVRQEPDMMSRLVHGIELASDAIDGIAIEFTVVEQRKPTRKGAGATNGATPRRSPASETPLRPTGSLRPRSARPSHHALATVPLHLLVVACRSIGAVVLQAERHVLRFAVQELRSFTNRRGISEDPASRGLYDLDYRVVYSIPRPTTTGTPTSAACGVTTRNH